MRLLTKRLSLVAGLALLTMFTRTGYSEDKTQSPATWMDKAETAINGAFSDGKTLVPFGSKIVKIIHPSGSNGSLEDIGYVRASQGHLMVLFTLRWEGGLLGTEYKTVISGDLTEEGYLGSLVQSDTAQTIVSKKAMAKLDVYLNKFFTTVLGDAPATKTLDNHTQGAEVQNPLQATLASLSEIRSGMQVFYGDNEGEFPGDLKDLTPKYLKVIPYVQIKPGLKLNTVAHPKLAAINSCRSVTGTGGWLYFNNRKNTATWGNVVIDSTELSPEGKRWCEY